MSPGPPWRGALGVALGFALMAACVPAHKLQRLPTGAPPASPREAFEQLEGGGQSQVALLSNNTAAWAERWRLLAAAEKTIDVTYFIVDQDVFGMAFVGHLYKRASEGVQVRMLIDGRGSDELVAPLGGKDHLQELVGTGHADVRVYNPPLKQLAQSLLQARLTPALAGTHNKILVIDGARAITGGRNIALPYFSSSKEEPHGFEDSDVLVSGAAVKDIAAVMDRDLQIGNREDIKVDAPNLQPRREELLMVTYAMDAWLHGRVPKAPYTEAALALEAAGLAPFSKLPSRAVRARARAHIEELARLGSLHGALLADVPQSYATDVRVVGAPSVIQGRVNTTGDALVAAIRAAQHSIVLESPYFVLTEEALFALEEASRRGVAIDVITNSAISTDNPPSQSLFFDTWPELMARLPTMRIFVKDNRPTLHAKRAVFDDALTLIGSYNIDPLSAYVNSELIVSVWSREFNRENRAEMRALLERGDMLEYTIQRIDERQARRHPLGHPEAGRVVVRFGPRDHVPQEQIAELVATKDLIVGLKEVWGLAFVVY